MEIERVDTRRAYQLIRGAITTLALAPGALINAQQLAVDFGVPVFAVEEALKILIHEHLVRATPRHGMYVSDVNTLDLEQLSELRIELEALAASLAAERATPDDLAVLEALRESGVTAGTSDLGELFELDRRFHEAIAHAARNVYLAQTLEHFFGLSLRLWYLVLPRESGEHYSFLPGAVEKHLELVDAIRRKDVAAAEAIARNHVSEFYLAVREELAASAAASGRREQ